MSEGQITRLLGHILKLILMYTFTICKPERPQHDSTSYHLHEHWKYNDLQMLYQKQ